MEEIAILEENYAKAHYVPNRKLIQIVWNGNLTTEQYQKAFIYALDFQEKSGVLVYNFISDTRKQGNVSPDNRKWFESYVIPRTVKQGLKRGAVVFDGSIFKKYYLNIILQSTNKFKLPFKLFNSFEEAFAWFDSFSDN